MQWSEIREAYPDQWLIIEALEAHTTLDHRRILDKIAVIEHPADGSAALESYRSLHQRFSEREFYFVNTSRKELDIRERQWLGIRGSMDFLTGSGAIIDLHDMEINF